MITSTQCRAIEHVLFTSGAADVFNTQLRGNKNGKEPSFNRAIFLAGMLLSAWIDGRTHITSIHKMLTVELPLEWQYKWGVRKERHLAGVRIEDWVVSQSDLQNVSSRIYEMFSHTETWLPDPENEPGKFDEERQKRRQALYDVVDRVIDACLIQRPADSHDYAIDSTGVWAAERYRKKLPVKEIADTATPAEVEETVAEEQARLDQEEAATGRTFQRKRRIGRSDAGIGVKTGKDGKRQWYFGHEVHAIVRVPQESGGGPRPEPALLERLRVSSPQEDIVAPSLEIIDSVLERGEKIDYLMVDRHYSYKTFDRWLKELLKRNINQVLDLRADEQGFKEWDDLLIAAGWPHCPSTPAHLGEIPKPGLTAPPSAWATFEKTIEERFAYAAERRKPLDAEGKSRWMCPAKAGKIGCPLRPETLVSASALGLLTVVNPPTGNLPLICTQDSIGLHAETDAQKSAMRTNQKDYWGLRKQLKRFGRRTFVEGFFGILKSDTAANKKRGSHLYTGRVHAVLDIMCFAVVANIRALRSWHEETGLGDPTHPLLAKENAKSGGIVYVSQEEFAAIREMRAAVA